jgi:hypothetical protein
LIGITPKKQPGQPENGWYALTIEACPDGLSLLEVFGLTPSGLSIMRNGHHVAPDEMLDDADEIQIFIKSLGG